MDPWWTEHPDLEGVARRARREIEQESAAAELDAEQLRKRHRSLTDVCYEWMSRGDLVTVAVGDRQFEGRLTEAINDLLVIATETFAVAVNVAMVRFARTDRPGAFPGTTGERRVSSFRAELGRHEVAGTPVRLIGRPGSFDLTAVIEASGDDHVLIRDQQGLVWGLPRPEIVCVIDPTPRE